MVQGQQQFSPTQILEAGRRAEAEGRVEYAVQFYRHLIEHAPRTMEALSAEQALQRIGAPPVGGYNGGPAPGHELNGSNGVNGHQGTREPARPVAGPVAVPVRPGGQTSAQTGADGVVRPAGSTRVVRRRYRAGRALARIVTLFGFFDLGLGAGLFVLAGVGAAGIVVPGLPGLLAGQPPLVAAAAGLVMTFIGLMLALGGQLARALFDQASAARDLAILKRLQLSGSGAF
jgi:hypothetical protein